MNGSLKTHVMFRSNLNSRQLKFYLQSLTAKGLLEEVREGENPQFRTTEKGRRFVELYGRLSEMLEGADVQLVRTYWVGPPAS